MRFYINLHRENTKSHNMQINTNEILLAFIILLKYQHSMYWSELEKKNFFLYFLSSYEQILGVTSCERRKMSLHLSNHLLSFQVRQQ